MAYYRGDYYRGDYYRGDLLGGLKKLGKAALGAVTGFVAGGPVGAITGAISGLKGPQGTQLARTPTFAAPIQTMGVVSGIGTAIRVGSKIAGPILAGKEVVDLARGFGFGANGKRRRTMNHLNPKALVRATRRVEGFVKKARKAVSPLGYTVVRRGSARAATRKRCR